MIYIDQLCSLAILLIDFYSCKLEGLALAFLSSILLVDELDNQALIAYAQYTSFLFLTSHFGHEKKNTLGASFLKASP